LIHAYSAINVYWHLFRVRVLESAKREIKLFKRETHLSRYNVPACIMRDCLSPGEFVLAKKNSHRVRESSTADCSVYVRAEIPDFDIYTPVQLPLFRPTCADSTRHERFGTSLEKLARDKTSVLAAKLRLFCLVFLSLLRPVSPLLSTSLLSTLLYSTSTDFANYPSPGTLISRVRRMRQEEKDLNGPERCHSSTVKGYAVVNPYVFTFEYTEIFKVIRNSL